MRVEFAGTEAAEGLVVEAAEAGGEWSWSVANGTGGMALVSDDLALLPATTRAHLESLLTTARAVDALARAGTPPHCPDLLTTWTPTTLSSTSHLTADPDTGTSTLT